MQSSDIGELTPRAMHAETEICWTPSPNRSGTRPKSPVGTASAPGRRVAMARERMLEASIAIVRASRSESGKELGLEGVR